MPIKCRIIRHPDTNRIVNVEAPNGENSLLYKDALAYTQNEEEALNLWTVSYLDKFKDLHGNSDFPQLEMQDVGQETVQKQTPKLVTEYLKSKGQNINILSEEDMLEEARKRGYDSFDAMVTAYHGSPYKFDKFSTSNIGTGEGLQAFGWGLYFTDLESIAKDYANKLTQYAKPSETLKRLKSQLWDREDLFNLITIENNKINGLLEFKKALFETEEVEIGNNSLLTTEEREYLEKESKNEKLPTSSVSDLQRYLYLDNIISDFYKALDSSRNLYKTSLFKDKDPSDYYFIEWDKSKTDYSNILKNYIGKLKEEYPNSSDFFDAKFKEFRDSVTELDGKTFYEGLLLNTYRIGKAGASLKDVSLLLNDIGVDGIKYPAESISRGATSDNARGFNYVVFDENVVTIEQNIQFLNNGEKIHGFYDTNTKEIYLTEELLSSENLTHELFHSFSPILKQKTDETSKAVLKELEKLSLELLGGEQAVKDRYNKNKSFENKSSETQDFFSDVVSGKSNKFKPNKPWEPILSFSKLEQEFKKVYDKYKGNFDEHIATSIPTFRETQIKVGSAIKEMLPQGGLLYDIGGSEGGFVKSVTESSEGKIESINLDPNPDMKKVHEDSPVEGSSFVQEAFYEGFDNYKKHTPSSKADVVHESMVFQFITPERKDFVKEVKDNYIKENGIFLTEEKLLPISEEEWMANENKKAEHKLKYYSQEQLTTKSEEVLVGMKKNQTYENDYVSILKDNFSHVAPYWDSGNFKGYIATDSKTKFDEFFDKLGGEITSEYSSKNNYVLSKDNSSSYANMTEDGQGNFVFYHRGAKGYDTIKKGTGQNSVTSREESSAFNKVGGVAMYYTRNEDSEQGVGQGATYIVKVPKDKVYDFNTDPLSYLDKAEKLHEKENPGKAFDFNTQLAYITRIAVENGFDMTVAQWGDRVRAQTTKELKPTDTQELEGNVVVKDFKNDYESNSKKGFVPIIPDSKTKQLKEVYDKIYTIRNSENKYDDLYHLYHEYNNYTEEEITNLIENSNLPLGIKEEYKRVKNSAESKRRSEIKFLTQLSSEVYNPREGESYEQYRDRMVEEASAILLQKNSVQYFERIAKENGLNETETKSFIQRIKDFIKNFGQWLTNQLGLENTSPEEIANLTQKELFDRITTSMLREPTDNIGTFDPNNNDIRFQVIGEKGAQKIEDYKKRLDKAKNLEKKGVSLSEISDRTGWYKFQGDWRLFSNEALEQFKINEDAIKEDTEQKLSGILPTDNILYDMYPALREVKIKVSQNSKLPNQASYSPKKNLIETNLFTGRGLQAAIAHELTHFVQREESLPTGADINTLQNQLASQLKFIPKGVNIPTPMLINELKKNRNKENESTVNALLSLIGDSSEQNRYKIYRAVLGEVDAHLVTTAYQNYKKGQLGETYEFLLEDELESINLKPNDVIKLQGTSTSSYAPTLQEMTFGDTVIKYTKAGNKVNLEEIQTPQEARGKGSARKALKQFLDIADKENSIVKLVVAPRDKSTDEVKLKEFYQSEGFEFDSMFGFPSDFEMIRYPQGLKEYQTPPNPFVDQNGEAKFQYVLEYLEQESKTTTELSNEDLVTVQNILRTKQVSMKELLAELEMFKSGSLNKEALQNSKIFNKAEQTNIMESEVIQNNLYNLSTTDIQIEDKTDYNPEFLILDGTINKYGVYNTKNPLTVEEDVKNTVAGIEDYQEFANAFNNLNYPDLVNKFNTDEEFSYEMYSKYSQMAKVSLLDIDLNPKMTPNKTTETKNSLDIDNLNTNPIEMLLEVSEEVWNESTDEVLDALNDIEVVARKAGIDLRNIEDNTRENIIELLTSIVVLKQDSSEETLASFLDTYKDFYNIEDVEAKSVEQVALEHLEKDLVRIDDSNKSEYTLFSENSLLKVDNGLYQRIDKMSLENLYELVYAEAVTMDNRLLPNKAYFNSNTIDNARLQSPENKQLVLNNIKTFINSNISKVELGESAYNTEVAEQLLLYKYYFETPIQFDKQESTTLEKELISSFDGNFDKLTSEFITKFQEEKIKGIEFYKHFTIDEQGIKLLEDNSISIEEVKRLIPDNIKKSFKNYAALTKDSAIKKLFTAENRPSFYDKYTQRNIFQNDINRVENVTQVYEMLDEQSMVTKQNNEFLKVGNKLFEKVQAQAGYNFYRQIETFNENFNVIKDSGILNKFSQEEIKPYLRSQENKENINNLYSQAELEEINQKHFNC